MSEAGTLLENVVRFTRLLRAAGLPVILVSFGYTAVPARDLGADHVVDSLREIPRLVAR